MVSAQKEIKNNEYTKPSDLAADLTYLPLFLPFFTVFRLYPLLGRPGQPGLCHSLVSFYTQEPPPCTPAVGRDSRVCASACVLLPAGDIVLSQL